MSTARDNGVYLDDILESIKRIEKATQGLSFEDFEKDIQIQDAIVHRLEIIGEASKHITQDFRHKYPEVSWREIAQTRDKITHHYFDVDLEIIWSIIQNDLKTLKHQVVEMLKNLDN